MIKKLLIIILAILVFAISCASTDKVAENEDTQDNLVADSDTKKNTVSSIKFKDINLQEIDSVNKYDNDAPGWYNNYGVFYQEYGTDVIIGTGQATGKSVSLGYRAATAKAQENVARQIITIINGLGTDETASITSVRLSGAEVIEKDMSDDGQTYYVAVMLDEKKTLETIERILASATKDNENYTDKELDITITEIQKRVDIVQTRMIEQVKN